MANNLDTDTVGTAANKGALHSNIASMRSSARNAPTPGIQTWQELATSTRSSEIKGKKRKLKARKQGPSLAPAITHEATASGSTAPPTQPGGSRDILEEFFSWRPDELKKDPKHSLSTATRIPRYFDMHLAEDLQLRNIVQVPGLAKAIAQTCDEHLRENPAVCNIPPKGFPGPKYRKRTELHLRHIDGRPKNEKGVESAYKHTAGQFCSQVASTLAFNLDSWGREVFACRSKARIDYKVARADVLLDVDDDELEGLSSQHRTNLALIAKHKIWHPVVWEFKSLTAGVEKTISRIASMEGEFCWTDCRAGSTNEKDSCDHPQHNVDGEWSITGRRTGPDSTIIWPEILQRTGELEDITEPPSNFDQDDSDAHDRLETEVDHEEDGEDGDSLEAVPDSGSELLIFNSDADAYDSDESGTTVIARPRKKRRTSPDVHVDHQDCEHGHEYRGIELSYNAGQESQTTEDPDKSECIVQQGWAEAVINDATFVVFSSGNHEVLGVRHRRSQTLYLSSIVDVANASNPAYGKLHTGLMLAGYRDASDRAAQLDRMVNLPKSIQPHLFSGLKFHPQDPYHTTEPAAGGDIAREIDIKKSLVDKIHDGETTTLLLVKAMSMSGYPDKRLCHLTGIQLANPRGPSGTIAKMHFSLRKEATAKVWHVSLTQLELANRPRFAANFVMKFGRTRDEVLNLKKEYRNYRELSALPVAEYIVPIFGLFNCSGGGDSLWALLMEDVGDTFAFRKASRIGKIDFTNNV